MTVLELPQVPAEERVNRNVRRLMKARGVTRSELATALGLNSPELVDQRLRGRTHWRLHQLEAAAQVLGVTVDLLYAEHLKIEVSHEQLLTLLHARESCLAA
jgi:transcriptional regulator with XRE-family HTH domain